MVGLTKTDGRCQELVTFDEGDPEDPVNWPAREKHAVVAILGVLSFVSVLGSSSYAPAQSYLMARYNINFELASSGLSLYVLGFAMGPLICPLSELHGRKLPFMVSWPLMIVATAPSAFANNISVILLFRFFTGCCAGCAINNGAGMIPDIYHNDRVAQAKTVAYYTFCPLSGPCFGSLIGFFVEAKGWHGLWIVRIHLFVCIACYPLVFLLPETHGPTILKRRACVMRAQGHSHAFAQQELELEPTNLWDIIQNHLLRAAKMLIYEPICQGAAIWIALAYGIIYSFFEVYPIVFVGQHNIPFRLCGLMFLFIPVGMLVALILYQWLTNRSTRLPLPIFGFVTKDVAPTDPENELVLVLSACVAMPISLFWFGWSSGPETHWVVPALAGIVFGYSMAAIFICFLAYIAQVYTIYSSSAGAANSFMRSIFAAAFPLVTRSLVKATGTKLAVSIFAFISLGSIPIPLILIRNGKKLRARSRYAQEARRVITGMGAYKNEEMSSTVNLDDLTTQETKVKPEIGA